MKLTTDANLVHETAEEMYDSYGWHITTEREGDVTIDAVKYDWLEGTDAEAIAKLRETCDGLTDDEAESIVAKAREVRDDMVAVEEMLDDAVVAHRAGDLDAVIVALEQAGRLEVAHGATPATDALRSQMLDEDDKDYESVA